MKDSSQEKALAARRAALIAAVALDADRAAFDALFADFAPRVKAYLLRLGLPPAQAEDLAQETLLMVWRKAALFDPARASASTWIFTIARNLRVDAVRRIRHPSDLDGMVDVPAEPLPSDILLAGERREKISAALKTLSAEQAAVVRLSFFEELAHSEIAKTLGVPLGTVKSRLRLAMTRLRAALDELL